VFDNYLAITIPGEFGFDDFMYNHKKEAYYKVAYLIFLLFALMMAVFVTNLLIGKTHRREREREKVHLIDVYFEIICALSHGVKEFLSDQARLFMYRVGRG